MWLQYLEKILEGDVRALARCISLVENEATGYEILLRSLPPAAKPIIGITGPPGAGKSTLTDALIRLIVGDNKRVGILCIDPSSPFDGGSLLGDRIRMSEWTTDPRVYIRSLATRGSLGGLHPKIIEITELLKAAPMDYIIVETVGVGQSEIEIAGLADVTIVVVVPESGDEIQAMKSGLMEIADIFVVNKADRPDAALFARNLASMTIPAHRDQQPAVPVLQTIASANTGIGALYDEILKQLRVARVNEKKWWLLAERTFFVIQQKRMKDINKQDLKKRIQAAGASFNLYQFIKDNYPGT
jgi:LAO/AO transport system kinase